jgi:hypothetical protein
MDEYQAIYENRFVRNKAGGDVIRTSGRTLIMPPK